MARIIAVLVVIIVAGFVLPGRAQTIGSADVPSWGPWKTRPTITVVSGEDDPRRPLVDEAVAFWNEQLAGIGSAFRLGSVSHTIGDIPAYALRQDNKKQGRPERLKVIASLRPIGGDILVVMTHSTTASFAINLPPPGRKIVTAISRGPTASAKAPQTAAHLVAIKHDVTLNTIAHEFGHAIGLGHNKQEGMLMCSGSPFCHAGSLKGPIFPLTEPEKRTLLAWYPRNWRPR